MKKILLVVFLGFLYFLETKTGLQAYDYDDNLILPKMSANQAFYFTHKWEFIERQFIENIDSEIDASNKFCKKLLIFLGSGIPSGAAATLIFSFFERNLKDGFAFSLGLVIGCVTGGFSVGAYTSKIEDEIYEKRLLYFLNRYNPKIDFLDVDNFKIYTPESLQPSFDSLWYEYNKYGKISIKESGFALIRNIREEIMYKINPKKYEPKPEIHIHNHNYNNKNIEIYDKTDFYIVKN